MNLKQYHDKIQSVDREATIAKKEIAREYALSNNTISVGDIIEDHTGKIRVTGIYTYNSTYPQCYYIGVKSKKDGTVTKREETRQVYQTNDVSLFV